jgi:hypothetical protein
MQTDRVSPFYHWVPMDFSKGSDFVGYDGQRMIGRVSRDGNAELSGWVWSNAIGSDTGHDRISQGSAPTKELAVLAIENHDRQRMEPRTA